MNYADVEHTKKDPPHDKIDWITLEVYITDEDGVTCQMVDDCQIWWEDGWSDYWWSEGNGSCDCNRNLFHNRELGLPEEYVDCSDGRYSVTIVVPKTGEVVYDDSPATTTI